MVFFVASVCAFGVAGMMLSLKQFDCILCSSEVCPLLQIGAVIIDRSTV